MTVETLEAEDVTRNSAKLRGELTDLDSEADVWFRWREDGETEWEETTSETMTELGEFDYTLDGVLDPDTTYEFKAVADEDGEVEGTTKTFTTDYTKEDVFTIYNVTEGEVLPVLDMELERETERMVDRAELEVQINEDIDINDKIEIYWDKDLEFAGRVTDIEEEEGWTVIVKGLGNQINDVKGKQIYNNEAPEDILKDAVEKLTDLEVVTEESGKQLQKYFFDGYLSDLVSDMAETLDWQVRTEPDGTLYFEPRGREEADVTLIDGQNCNVTDWERDREQMVNDVEVIGGTSYYNTSEEFDSGQEEYDLTYMPSRQVYVEVDGEEQKGGIASRIGEDDDYVVDKENRKLIFDEQTTGDVYIEYEYAVPVMVKSELPTSIQKYGRKAKRVEKKHLETFEDAREYVSSYLDIYGTPLFHAEAVTTVDKDLNVGEVVEVIDNRRDRHENLVVNEKIINLDGSVELILGADTFNIFDWQAETQRRIRELEKELREEEFIMEYLSFDKEVDVSIDIKGKIKKRYINDSFILGHPDNSVLGTDKLGDRRGTWSTLYSGD